MQEKLHHDLRCDAAATVQRAWKAHCYGIAQAKWLEVIRAEQQRAAGIIQRRYGAKGGAKGGADAQKKGRRSTVGPTPHSTPARAGAGAPRDRAASIKPPAAERGSANGRSGSNRKRSTAPTATPTAGMPTAGMMPPTAAGRTPYTPRSSGAPSAAASISGDAPAAAAPAAAAPRKLFDGERRAAEGTSAELEAAAALIQGAAASTLGPNSADLEAAAALLQGAAASTLGPSSSDLDAVPK